VVLRTGSVHRPPDDFVTGIPSFVKRATSEYRTLGSISFPIGSINQGQNCPPVLEPLRSHSDKPGSAPCLPPPTLESGPAIPMAMDGPGTLYGTFRRPQSCTLHPCTHEYVQPTATYGKRVTWTRGQANIRSDPTYGFKFRWFYRWTTAVGTHFHWSRPRWQEPGSVASRVAISPYVLPPPPSARIPAFELRLDISDPVLVFHSDLHLYTNEIIS